MFRMGARTSPVRASYPRPRKPSKTLYVRCMFENSSSAVWARSCKYLALLLVAPEWLPPFQTSQNSPAPIQQKLRYL